MCQTQSCMFCRYRRRAAPANLPVPTCAQENLQRGKLDAAERSARPSPTPTVDRSRAAASMGHPPC
jgi:hypothetical protein